MNKRQILSRKTLSACWDLLIWDFKRQFSPKIWVFFPLANGTLSWGSRWSEWVRNDLTGNIWLNHCLFWHVAGHLGLYRSKFGFKTTKLQLFLSRTLTHLNRSQSCLIEAFGKGLVEPRLHLRLSLTQCGLNKALCEPFGSSQIQNRAKNKELTAFSVWNYDPSQAILILLDQSLCQGPSWAHITSKTWFNTKSHN